MNLVGRHPGTFQVAQHFRYDHLPEHLQAVSKPCHDLAAQMIDALPDGPELTFGLRQLLLAKDAFVREAVLATKPARPVKADDHYPIEDTLR